MPGDSLPGVNMVLLRAYVAWCVDQVPEPRRTALVAALERGDATIQDVEGGYVGVKVMGQQLAKVHRSRLLMRSENS